jgi:hypothetical protein
MSTIEKLWKYFRQDFLHIHRFCDDLEILRAKAQRFFEGFAQGSAQLLQYVGLGVPYFLLRQGSIAPTITT